MINILIVAKLIVKLSCHYQDAKDAYLLLNYIYKILPLVKYMRKRVQLAEPFVLKLFTVDDII